VGEGINSRFHPPFIPHNSSEGGTTHGLGVSNPIYAPTATLARSAKAGRVDGSITAKVKEPRARSSTRTPRKSALVKFFIEFVFQKVHEL
jgi:hypothetical protein